MDKKKILLISALVLGLAALPTLTIDPNSFVLDRIDSQLLVACLGAISAIVLRPMLKDRQQRWRNRRVAKSLDSRSTRPTQP
jgi:xanthine/uracil permease